MVSALSVVGTSLVDSYLCVDALPTTTTITGGVNGNKQCLVRRGNNVELSSSFVVYGVREWRLSVNRSFKKQRKDNRRVAIVNELGGQYEETFNDVKTQLLNYFTVKAVRTVLQQLYEMNPPKYRFFYNFVATNEPSDGKRFLRSLAKEHQELAERVMVTRLHLYGKWVKKCNHAEIYEDISNENLELMRERLIETVIWPSDDTNTEKIG
ncbi:hypothetical protein HN51_049223 [Arachis hypogaea]|uniref:Chaperonin-like RbcX protein n=1 Tax=Arachis hypogaea TaxID=3818 RepID=A0A444YFS2_ARAHY|nr:chaperonin-like RbcX protein 2, chloroplastic [Arachis ipaensis]XP_025608307.1 chaperonin-like RbcX protein 2, chloroplastic [Arachis hypogaea]XP_025666872.1 chaperonin-like RbcX protein 2, chloroplastic [Arachis hypogaea]XP_057725736.1 chaperonin-like RbcX protein 2, chloroplastic [Arachis stenosperma]QHN90903.1 uncharacterized protein DS421_17g570420 [Arachis hypogaea]QHO26487.1 uncharacterized protein DS421_7g199960 [Arachis hypogaea]RYR00741.1 hypothetical protein Ahy_B07g088863 [Arach